MDTTHGWVRRGKRTPRLARQTTRTYKHIHPYIQQRNTAPARYILQYRYALYTWLLSSPATLSMTVNVPSNSYSLLDSYFRPCIVQDRSSDVQMCKYFE